MMTLEIVLIALCIALGLWIDAWETGHTEKGER